MRLIAQARRRVTRAWHESGNGYWADLKPGLRCTLADTHTCHEDTLAQLEVAIAAAAPCKCCDCKAIKRRRAIK